MYATELRLAVIDDVIALSQVEIDDVEGKDLFDILVVLPAVDIVGDEL